MVCCFFGHKDTPASITHALETVIEYLMQERDVDEFLVGNHGNFWELWQNHHFMNIGRPS